MFSTLPASALPRELDARGVCTSVVFHAAAIGTAVWLTATAARVAAPASRDVLKFYVAPPPVTAAPVTAPRPVTTVANPAAPTAEFVVPLPEFVPVTLPPVNSATNAVPFDWEHVLLKRAGAPAWRGVPGAGPESTSVYAVDVVERAVSLLPNQPVPRYPEALRLAGVGGRVVARFVVDTAGRVEAASIEFPEASHALFAEAVRSALQRQRFAPAEMGGHRVRQLVLQPFSFVANR